MYEKLIYNKIININILNIQNIDINKLEISSLNVRKLSDSNDNSFLELKNNIKDHGLLNPLTVKLNMNTNETNHMDLF